MHTTGPRGTDRRRLKFEAEAALRELKDGDVNLRDALRLVEKAYDVSITGTVVKRRRRRSA